jgi:predicted dienelactone hydrolase
MYKRAFSSILLLAVIAIWTAQAWASKFDDVSGAFVDASRNRKVPYKIYFPKPLDGKYPVVIVSHGIGGSRESNVQLGKHLASNGFVVLNIQHEGSDEALLQGVRDRRLAQLKLAQSLRDPRNAVNRFLDVPFVVAQLSILNDSDKQLKGHLKIDALGMAGHSYGAISTMVAAGERVGAEYASGKVSSLRAGLLLSPSPPRDGADVERVYRDVSIPLFHMTGTEDASLLDARNVSPSDRVKPYRLLSVPNQYLLVLNQADHKSFSNEAHDKRHTAAILDGALAFFNAYLRDDRDAEQWLRTEYKKTLAPQDVFAFK